MIDIYESYGMAHTFLIASTTQLGRVYTFEKGQKVYKIFVT